MGQNSALTPSRKNLRISIEIKKGELDESRLRVDWIVLTRNLIWVMPT